MRGGQSKLGYCPIRGDTGIPRLRDGHEVTRFPLRKEVGHDSGSAVEGLGVFFPVQFEARKTARRPYKANQKKPQQLWRKIPEALT